MPVIRKPVSVGFSGTRFGMKRIQASIVRDLLEKLKPDVVHHGCCVGADAEFHQLARELVIPIVGHPSLSVKRQADLSGFSEVCPPKDYIVRNHDIVDSSLLIIVAANTTYEIQRSGTWATYRYAKKLGRMIYQVTPSGHTVLIQAS